MGPEGHSVFTVTRLSRSSKMLVKGESAIPDESWKNSAAYDDVSETPTGRREP